MVNYYNPYESIKGKGKWLRTNFHVHCELNDAESAKGLRHVLEAYRIAGYDIIMNSGQGIWVDTSDISKEVRLKTFNGTEYIEQDGMLFVGTGHLIGGSPQEALDACLEDGGFAVVCHPNWIPTPHMPIALPKEVSRELNGVTGIEIYNRAIFDRFLGSGLATDFWDECLSSGRVLWGFANDDFHEIHDMDTGWSVIFASSDDFYDVKTAVQRGSLYASNGLKLYDFTLEDNVLEVEADYPHDRRNRITYRFIGEDGKLLKEDFGTKGTYLLNGNEAYVRVEARGESGAMLWCQPILDRRKFII